MSAADDASAPQRLSQFEAYALKQLGNAEWVQRAATVVRLWLAETGHDLSQPGGLQRSMGQSKLDVMRFLQDWQLLVKPGQWRKGDLSDPANGELAVCCVLAGLARYIPVRLLELQPEAGTGGLPAEPVLGFDDPLVAQLVAACLYDTRLELPRAGVGNEFVALSVIQGVVDPQFKHLTVDEAMRLEIKVRSDGLLGLSEADSLMGHYATANYAGALQSGVPEDDALRISLQALKRRGIQLMFLPHASSAAGQWLTPDFRKKLKDDFGIPSASYGSHLLTEKLKEHDRMQATINDYLKTIREAIVTNDKSSVIMKSAPGVRRKVFLSFSHKEDAKWLAQVRIMLDTLKTEVELWHDGKIEPGTQWHPTILKAVEESQVALLLVSKPFLASDYVREHEFPAILKRHDAGQLDICPLLVGSIDPGAQPWFRENQLFDSRPLRGMDDHEADEVLTKVSVYLRTGRRAQS
jgi:hypothetical protein